jgi:chemotaxis protein histidine kinase CheA
VTSAEPASGDRELWDLFRTEAAERTNRITGLLSPMVEAERAPDAGELDQLLEDARREAHTVKGAAGMMGLQPLYELAERLEQALSRARAAGEVPEERARALIDAAHAFVDGAEAAAAGLELPASVGESLEALRPPEG